MPVRGLRHCIRRNRPAFEEIFRDVPSNLSLEGRAGRPPFEIFKKSVRLSGSPAISLHGGPCMPVPALRLKEPTFREGIANYVTAKCRRYRVPRVDVDDLTQEAMINIIARVSTFQPEKSEFEQWARGIAWNVIREYLRKAKLYFALFTEYHASVHDYPAQDPSPERCARRNQARCAIENAAKGVSSKRLQVLVLHALHDMSHGEIGRELDMSETNSQKCYQRARNHLAHCLSGKAFAVMPPSLTGCDESATFNETDSRWPERSHYVVQFAAAIMAVFLVFALKSSTTTHEPTTGEDALVLAPVQNAAMYRYDELVVHRDAPSGKPEPASLPSVCDVSTPAKLVDKPPPFPEYVPRLSHKHEPSSSDHRPNGR